MSNAVVKTLNSLSPQAYLMIFAVGVGIFVVYRINSAVDKATDKVKEGLDDIGKVLDDPVGSYWDWSKSVPFSAGWLYDKAQELISSAGNSGSKGGASGSW